MEESVLTSVVLPASLFIIMLGMGLSLIPDDFKRIIKFPKPATIGLVNQLILLPLFGWLLAVIFALPPALAVGLMILAACPGGVTSNLITHVAKGDTALSITLTAIASFITVITIPLIISWALVHFMGDSSPVELPILKTIMQVVGITIIPVSIGMWVRHKNPRFADRMEKPSRIASTVIFLVILVGIILANKDLLVDSFKELGLVTLSLNILTMGIGFLAARIFRLNVPQTLAISIESGIQNGTLAIVIATSILKQPDMALVAGVYSLIMFVSGGALMAWFGTRKVELST